jgi:chorismate-pyruvate lyase
MASGRTPGPDECRTDTARALRDADVKPEGLWARRSRVALRGAPLLMQEVFLPGMGRS